MHNELLKDKSYKDADGKMAVADTRLLPEFEAEKEGQGYFT